MARKSLCFRFTSSISNSCLSKWCNSTKSWLPCLCCSSTYVIFTKCSNNYGTCSVCCYATEWLFAIKKVFFKKKKKQHLRVFLSLFFFSGFLFYWYCKKKSTTYFVNISTPQCQKIYLLFHYKMFSVVY